MKAQISFVEFLTSILIFITFVGYFSLQILVFVPSYINEITGERLRSEAFQLSELLINDPGQPLNWHLDFLNAERIGLSDHTLNRTNLLSGAKISVLNSKCQENYDNIKSLLGTDYDFLILLIEGGTGELKINCHPTVTKFRQFNTTIKRVVAYNEDGTIKYGEMILQVW